MAIYCLRCGTILPKDGARFCSTCGNPVPSDDLPSAPSTSQIAPPVAKKGHEKPVLREQIAQQPPARAGRHAIPDQPPTWISQLDVSTCSPERAPVKRDQKQSAEAAQKSEKARDESLEPGTRTELTEYSPTPWPAPVTHVAAPEPASPKEGEVGIEQHDFLTSPPQTPRPATPVRELRVRVWEEQDEQEERERRGLSLSQAAQSVQTQTPVKVSTPPMPQIPQTPRPSMLPVEETRVEEDVEDLPTRPMQIASEQTRSHSISPDAERQQQEDQHREEIEALDTALLSVAVKPVPAFPQLPDTPRPTDLPPIPVEARPISPSVQVEKRMEEPSITVRPVEKQSSSAFPASVGPYALPGQAKTRKHSSAFVFAIILLVLLIVGGAVATWVALYHPFSIPEASLPVQQFQDARLGIALSYPTGWQWNVDQAKSIAHFHDSSSTALVDIGVTNAADAVQSLQHQATALGMTALKPLAPLTFAGATWQQLQGTVQRDGANYTVTLLATVHGNRLFTITQTAHQSIADAMEREAFDPLRKSFRFLA